MKAKKVICFCVLIAIMVCLIMVLSRRINLDSQKKDVENEVSVEVEDDGEVAENEDAEDVASEEETTEPEALYYGWFEELLKTADLEVTSKPDCYVVEFRGSGNTGSNPEHAIGYNIGKLTENLSNNPIRILEFLADKRCFARGEKNTEGKYNFVKQPIKTRTICFDDIYYTEDEHEINPSISRIRYIEKEAQSENYSANDIMRNIFQCFEWSYNPWNENYFDVIEDCSLEVADDCLYKYIQVRSDRHLILMTIYFKYDEGKLCEVSSEIYVQSYIGTGGAGGSDHIAGVQEELFCTALNYLSSVEYAVTGNRKMYELFKPYSDDKTEVLPETYMNGDAKVSVEYYTIDGITNYHCLTENGMLFKYKIEL